jgi:D-tyrosyl-tRNA(Tyr) deacylase
VRAVVQRVTRAEVRVLDGGPGADAGQVVGQVGAPGLCVFVGATHTDTPAHARRLADKLATLRVFDTAEGERCAVDVGASVLVVSQFTLYADLSRGRRPSWIAAAPGPTAEPLVDEVVARLRAAGLAVATGRFGAHMAVDLVNDGPMTLLVEV